jgi:superfamily II DNA helicase RecQ
MDQDDINNYLQLRGPKVAVGSAYRPNLVLTRSQPRGLKRDLERIAEAWAEVRS